LHFRFCCRHATAVGQRENGTKRSKGSFCGLLRCRRRDNIDILDALPLFCREIRCNSLFLQQAFRIRIFRNNIALATSWQFTDELAIFQHPSRSSEPALQGLPAIHCSRCRFLANRTNMKPSWKGMRATGRRYSGV